jgi:hypothetical protein
MGPEKSIQVLGTKDSHDIEHKNEKGKLKKEYWRKLRLV